jgi:hypothetical protein
MSVFTRFAMDPGVHPVSVLAVAAAPPVAGVVAVAVAEALEAPLVLVIDALPYYHGISPAGGIAGGSGAGLGCCRQRVSETIIRTHLAWISLARSISVSKCEESQLSIHASFWMLTAVPACAGAASATNSTTAKNRRFMSYAPGKGLVSTCQTSHYRLAQQR